MCVRGGGATGHGRVRIFELYDGIEPNSKPFEFIYSKCPQIEKIEQNSYYSNVVYLCLGNMSMYATFLADVVFDRCGL